MREFELLPNEEQIRDMAAEYGLAKARREMLENHGVAIKSRNLVMKDSACKAPAVIEINPCNVSKGEDIITTCGREMSVSEDYARVATVAERQIVAIVSDSICDYTCIAELYYMNRDIERALRRLYTLAKKDAKESINMLIKTRQESAEILKTSLGKSDNRDANNSTALLSNYYVALSGEIVAMCEKAMYMVLRLDNSEIFQKIFARETLSSIIINRLYLENKSR